jgi:hypothetical protein
MLYGEYEKILIKGKKVDWYGDQVPEELITKAVIYSANQIVEQIDKCKSIDSKQNNVYIRNLWENVKLLPYKMNGDFYLIKKKKIEEKNKVKPKIKKEKEPENKKVTKNSSLIFGNKTK